MCSEARGREHMTRSLPYCTRGIFFFSLFFLFARPSFQRVAAVSFRAKLNFAASPSLPVNALTEERGMWLADTHTMTGLSTKDKGTTELSAEHEYTVATSTPSSPSVSFSASDMPRVEEYDGPQAKGASTT